MHPIISWYAAIPTTKSPSKPWITQNKCTPLRVLWPLLSESDSNCQSERLRKPMVVICPSIDSWSKFTRHSHPHVMLGYTLCLEERRNPAGDKVCDQKLPVDMSVTLSQITKNSTKFLWIQIYVCVGIINLKSFEHHYVHSFCFGLKTSMPVWKEYFMKTGKHRILNRWKH